MKQQHRCRYRQPVLMVRTGRMKQFHYRPFVIISMYICGIYIYMYICYSSAFLILWFCCCCCYFVLLCFVLVFVFLVLFTSHQIVQIFTEVALLLSLVFPCYFSCISVCSVLFVCFSFFVLFLIPFSSHLSLHTAFCKTYHVWRSLILEYMINYERLLYRYKGCKDNPEKAAHCKYWTIKGECTRAPQFMKNNCNQSCGFCSEYILQCFNGAKMCDLPCLFATFNLLHLSDYWNFGNNEKLSLLIHWTTSASSPLLFQKKLRFLYH